MATPSRRTTLDLREQLLQAPYRFQFFQAVRLLERAAAQAVHKESGEGRRQSVGVVGEDEPPRQEVVRFRTLMSLTFPAGDIATLTPSAAPDEDGNRPPPEMTVPFLGLTGPAGVLPQHYTQL